MIYCNCGYGFGWTHCGRCGAPLENSIAEADWKAEQLRVQAGIREEYRRHERRQNIEAALAALVLLLLFVAFWWAV